MAAPPYDLQMPTAIRAEVDEVTAALVHRIAQSQGRSVEAFASAVIREAAEQEAELLNYAQPGLDDLDAGRSMTQDQFVAWLAERKSGTDSI